VLRALESGEREREREAERERSLLEGERAVVGEIRVWRVRAVRV
jgi:hypothetical protein